VADDVGERLLHDAVRRQRHAVRHGCQVALGAHVDRDAGGGDLGDEPVHVRQPRGRSEQRPGVLGVPQHHDQPAELGQRVPAGGFDDLEGPLRRCRVAARGEPPGARVHSDDAHAVRHDVVQLARDPHPLRGDGEAGELVTRLLELRRAPGVRGGRLPPAEDDVAEVPGSSQQPTELQPGRHSAHGRAKPEQGREHRLGGAEHHQRPPPLHSGRRRVDAHQHGRPQHHGRQPQGAVSDRRERLHAEHRRWCHPPAEEGRAVDRGDPPRRRNLPGGPPGRELGREGQRGVRCQRGQRKVEQPTAPLGPQPSDHGSTVGPTGHGCQPPDR
jgi:hypothetical protein